MPDSHAHGAVANAGVVLKKQRFALGMSQRRVAQLLGTRQSNISAYEKETLLPGRMLRGRIEAFTELDPGSSFTHRDILTLPAHAMEIKRLLPDGEADVTRLLVQLSDDFGTLTNDSDRRFFLSEPSTVSDEHYDALLAGLAVHLARQAQLATTPRWTTRPNRYSPDMWFYGPAGSIKNLRAAALRDAVASMRARGVIFSRRNLESV